MNQSAVQDATRGKTGFSNCAPALTAGPFPAAIVIAGAHESVSRLCCIQHAAKEPFTYVPFLVIKRKFSLNSATGLRGNSVAVRDRLARGCVSQRNQPQHVITTNAKLTPIPRNRVNGAAVTGSSEAQSRSG